MKKLIWSELAFTIMALSAMLAAQPRQVEMTFENRLGGTSLAGRVDFYTDGHFSCSANTNMTCDSMEQDTGHTFEGRQNGKTIEQASFTQKQIADGGYDWGVCVVGKTCPNQ